MKLTATTSLFFIYIYMSVFTVYTKSRNLLIHIQYKNYILTVNNLMRLNYSSLLLSQVISLCPCCHCSSLDPCLFPCESLYSSFLKIFFICIGVILAHSPFICLERNFLRGSMLQALPCLLTPAPSPAPWPWLM